MFRFVAPVLFFAAFVTARMSPALSQVLERDQFDPAKCSSNADGQFYVALGRSVLRLDPKNDYVVDPLIDREDKGLQPPDSSEPVGCRTNPRQLRSIAFRHDFRVPLDAQYQFRPSGVELIRLNPGKEAWLGERTSTKMAQDVCLLGPEERFSRDLLVCRVDVKRDSKDDRRAGYFSAPGGYATPLGRTFAAFCSEGRVTYGIGGCTVTYALNNDFGLTYELRAAKPGMPFPMEYLVDVDRDLRATITSFLVQNYEWPTAERGPENSR